jgi:hypothetical protein
MGRRAARINVPWWADKMIYTAAYLQGKGVEIPKRRRKP